MMQADIHIFHLVNGLAGNWLLDRLAGYEEGNNLLKGGLFMAAFWYFWFQPHPDRELRRKTIIAVLLGAFLALVANRAIAAVTPFRVRPMYDPVVGYVPPSIAILFNLEEWSAFPSDTATWFFALSAGIAALSRPLGIAFGVHSAVYICLPRLYLGIHYPSDLVAGALLGVVVPSLVNTRFIRRVIAAPIVAVEERSPGPFYTLMFLASFEMTVLFNNIRYAARGTIRMLRHYHLATGALTLGIVLAALAAAALLTLYRRRSAAAARSGGINPPLPRSAGMP
jgi:undecaprenyl-diphosphatase